ncbi:hypothetical protein KI387_043208, partial [Taxus chinensis]
RPCHTPTSSPIPSPASHPSSSRRHHRQVSSDSDSDVEILGPSIVGFVPPVSLVRPPSLSLTSITDLVALVALIASSTTSSSELRLSNTLLGLSQLYPDSPESDPIGLEVELKVEGLNFQLDADNIIMEDRDTNPKDVQMDVVPNWKDSASGNIEKANTDSATDTENHPEDCHVELVTSILAKLQCSFSILKSLETFTENTKATITKDCTELLMLVDQLADELGSIHANNFMIELKKFL